MQDLYLSQIQPSKPALDHADSTAHTPQPELLILVSVLVWNIADVKYLNHGVGIIYLICPGSAVLRFAVEPAWGNQ